MDNIEFNQIKSKLRADAKEFFPTYDKDVSIIISQAIKNLNSNPEFIPKNSLALHKILKNKNYLPSIFSEILNQIINRCKDENLDFNYCAAATISHLIQKVPLNDFQPLMDIIHDKIEGELSKTKFTDDHIKILFFLSNLFSTFKDKNEFQKNIFIFSYKLLAQLRNILESLDVKNIKDLFKILKMCGPKLDLCNQLHQARDKISNGTFKPSEFDELFTIIQRNILSKELDSGIKGSLLLLLLLKNSKWNKYQEYLHEMEEDSWRNEFYPEITEPAEIDKDEEMMSMIEDMNQQIFSAVQDKDEFDHTEEELVFLETYLPDDKASKSNYTSPQNNVTQKHFNDNTSPWMSAGKQQTMGNGDRTDLDQNRRQELSQKLDEIEANSSSIPFTSTNESSLELKIDPPNDQDDDDDDDNFNEEHITYRDVSFD